MSEDQHPKRTESPELARLKRMKRYPVSWWATVMRDRSNAEPISFGPNNLGLPVGERRECALYIGSEDVTGTHRVLDAAVVLLILLGANGTRIVDVEYGSVLVRLKAWGRAFAKKREVRIVASQLVQTAEAMTVEKAQAENAAKYASAVAELLAAAGDRDLALDFGTLQFVQYRDDDGKVQARARALSSKEIATGRIDDATIRDPKAMFKVLDADGENSVGG